jgi:hypothetical protein
MDYLRYKRAGLRGPAKSTVVDTMGEFIDTVQPLSVLRVQLLAETLPSEA